MGYSVSDSVVRADRFKASGKWYDSIALEMGPYYDYANIHRAVGFAFIDWFQSVWIEREPTLGEFHLVVLEPYHKSSCPVMMDESSFTDYLWDRINFSLNTEKWDTRF